MSSPTQIHMHGNWKEVPTQIHMHGNRKEVKRTKKEKIEMIRIQNRLSKRRQRDREKKELEKTKNIRVLKPSMDKVDFQDETEIPAVKALLKQCKLKNLNSWKNVLDEKVLRVVHTVSFVISGSPNIALQHCGNHPLTVREQEEILPREFTVQVMDKQRQEWTNLFVIKPSTIKGAGFGCFAARNYSCGQALGKYFGKIVDHVNVKYKPYTMLWPKIGKYVEQQGVGTGLKNRTPVYFGLHFCNDLGFKGTRNQRPTTRHTNVSQTNAWVHDEDLTVYASSYIQKGHEIFLDYQLKD